MAAWATICAYVAERCGSSLSRLQRVRLSDAVSARIGSRTELQYLEHLKSLGGARELADLMATISVHKTDLFRDESQLEAVRSAVLLPKALLRRPVHVWSAGCATGEEVATLLILLAEAGAHPDSTVLGTDISASALAAAQGLSFGRDAVRRVPEILRERYFRPAGEGHQLVEALRQRARFVRHNLMDLPYPAPAAGAGFDLIFCRNVLIYFTENAFEQTVGRLAGSLAPHGVLVLSAAEPLLRARGGLTLVRHAQSFMYSRDVAPAAPIANLNVGPLGARVITGEFRIAAAPGIPAPPAPSRPSDLQPPAPTDASDGVTDGEKLFQLVLDWAASGQSDAETESGLRRCLYLSPDLACARYLLGMLCESRGALADAASEYRRALTLLRDGRARSTPFFLNNARLRTVCERAVERLGFRERSD